MQKDDGVEDLPAERLPAPVETARLPGPPAGRRRIALLLALAVDFLQWVAFPLFLSGALSPVVNVVDVATAIVMIVLLGWHWAFLPTFVVELLPVVDLVPTWTLAVWIATRGRKG
jgi:hypothetical protein